MSIDFELIYNCLNKEFNYFRELILEKNRILNLTRIVSDEDFKYKHIQDSIMPMFLSEYFNFKFFQTERKVLDVGTGGGFPLIPLAILFTDRFLHNEDVSVFLPESATAVSPKFFGLDSVKKKIRAVSDVVASLNLKHIDFLSDRAEFYGRHPMYRATFDCVTSRAVAEIPILLEYCAPFVKKGGFICMYKSFGIADELRSSARAAECMGVRLIEERSYRLSGEMGDRMFLVYKKVAATSSLYPRSIGVAKKNPII